MRPFIIVLVSLLLTSSALAEQPNSQGSQGPQYPKKGNFYLGIFDPYPATFGLGITHYPNEYLGLHGSVGMGGLITYAIGIRFRPVVKKFAPLIGVTWSAGDEPTEGTTKSRKGFLSVQTGVEWKWDSGMYMGLGAHWGVTPRLGKSDIKPFLQIGLAY